MFRFRAMGDDPLALARDAAQLRAQARDLRATVGRLLPRQGPDVWRGRRADRLAADLAEDHHVLAHVADRLEDAAAELDRRAQGARASSM
jgi:hypothetical protein